jgi:hypothetical protein
MFQIEHDRFEKADAKLDSSASDSRGAAIRRIQ